MKMQDLFVLRKDNAVLKDYMNSQIHLAKDTLWPGIDDLLIKKIEKIFEKGAMHVLLECVNGETAEPYTVICHGDCWNNNVLYKSDKVKNVHKKYCVFLHFLLFFLGWNSNGDSFTRLANCTLCITCV